uniref:PID domain-containing protein n=1 Tax=Panagrolaimus sp. ES5 TaxID=591445 RepID=A0AC34G2J8_9BILA
MSRPDSSISTGIVKIGYQWIHPPSSLIHGRVNYVVRMLGFIEVAKPTGANVIRDAYLSLKFLIEQPSTSQKPMKVELSINVSEVQINDVKTKKLLHAHTLRKISYCADDKENRRIFAYIATDDNQKHEYFDKETTKFKATDDISKLKERIEQLEAENEALKFERDALKRKQMIMENMSPPPLPKTPIPKRPTNLALPPSCGNPFLFPSSSDFSPPPLDRAPSLEDYKSSISKAAEQNVVVASFSGLNLDCSMARKKAEIFDEIDDNKHDAIAAKVDGMKNSDLKLVIPKISSQNNDTDTVTDVVKFGLKDNDAEEIPALKIEKPYDADKHAHIKENDSDDDYMIPRYKLGNP